MTLARWLVKPAVAWSRLVRIARLRAHHPFSFGSLDGPAYKVLSQGIFRGLRGPYLLGAVIGAVQARMVGSNQVLFLEFGVASGGGLRSLRRIAELIEGHFAMRAIVVGFDSAEGLPELTGAVDHPELWRSQQFPMTSKPQLLNEFSTQDRQLILGDIRETITRLDEPFLAGCPIGFMSIDVDLYSSAKPILDYLGRCAATRLLPAAVVHCDDAYIAWTYSRLAGEERAIHEFNETHENRRLDLKDRSLRLFSLNCLDHPMRAGQQMPHEPIAIVIDKASSYL